MEVTLDAKHPAQTQEVRKIPGRSGIWMGSERQMNEVEKLGEGRQRRQKFKCKGLEAEVLGSFRETQRTQDSWMACTNSLNVL